MTNPVETRIDGLVAIEPTIHGDERGFLIESFRADRWRELGIDEEFVQENHSRSTQRGTLRGMHFQTEPGQGKLVRCPRGAIYDVAVDLRRGSPTFLRWHGERLSGDNGIALLIPEGFAHGLQTLSDDVDMLYCHSAAYVATAEGGLHPREPRVGVDWPLPFGAVSPRDDGHAFVGAEFDGIDA